MKNLPTRGAALACLLLLGCDATHHAGDVGQQVRIQVAPLHLSDIRDAHYTLTVTNNDEPPQVVWTAEVTSGSYGDGAGSLSYVGPCDAASSPNRVTLELDWLVDSDGLTIAGDAFPNPTPVWRDVPCTANADSPVSFDLVIARPANQGFFDVAVDFNDIFCSAKLDCVDDDGQPIKLLHNGAVRDTTIVVGLVCTTGEGEQTVLHADSMVLDCGQDGVFHLPPVGGPGNVGGTAPFIFSRAVYRGREAVTGADICYLNQAIGVDLPAAVEADATCSLRGKATASPTAWPSGRSPAGALWPYVSWNVPVLSAGALICGHHGLDLDAGVETRYSDLDGGALFPFGMACTADPAPALDGAACAGTADAIFGTSDDGVLVSIGGAVTEPFLLPEGVELGGCCVDGD
ncbi:MAG: hypothetical protein CVU56_14515 [Deltaproteobacteria bacterium HGW-Deltaproteobacteria-14]|jgi:hypothetical protein|nr:MAG: hypothetical protein CVU56_14515 [Deltaproteobacteria bacterium HGW-Deltaproteobacteria-14]